jgi:hypothetical protein
MALLNCGCPQAGGQVTIGCCDAVSQSLEGVLALANSELR